MQSLLTNIELDIQELKCLMDAFSREPNVSIREVLRRNILQMRGRLDQLLSELDRVSQDREPQTETRIEETAQITSALTLGERIRPAAELRRSISLNDSFRFSRELFNSDIEQMNRVIQQISEMNSLGTATAFLLSKVMVGEENEALADFMELLKKFFN